ncbi:hypothetical protein PMAYCL1PPCAC_02850, partial [Pristionchus mayeri]
YLIHLNLSEGLLSIYSNLVLFRCCYLWSSRRCSLWRRGQNSTSRWSTPSMIGGRRTLWERSVCNRLRGTTRALSRLILKRSNWALSLPSRSEIDEINQRCDDPLRDGLYQIRSVSTANPNKPVYSSAKPCLILRARLMHELFITISPRTRSLLSATLFPDPLFLNNDEECPEVSSSDSAHATVVVATESTLPSPDTQSYLDKMEKEKRARQHGAESDNRSFLAKYWMYIVPVVIFVLVSNAVNPDQGGEQ